MNLSPTQLNELDPLLEGLCEERLSETDYARLEQLLLSSAEVRAYYRQYLDLHGALHWDAAVAAQGDADDAVNALVDATIMRLAQPATLNTVIAPQLVPGRTAWLQRGLAAAAAVVILGVGIWIGNRTAGNPQVALQKPALAPPQTAPRAERSPVVPEAAPRPDHKFTPNDVQLAAQPASSPPEHVPDPATAEALNVATAPPERKPFVPVRPQSATAGTSAASSATVIAFINEQLQAGWQQAGIIPSAKADDAEWLRRVNLDLVGHIPSVKDVERFLSDRSKTKRAAEIDRLLDSPEYARHFATIWTDLLVGRASRPEVNRTALAKFLRDNFQRNRPWQEMVFDLVTAEGRTDQNGATNFLVAHLNDGAIPATGITSRLFLGTQLQCAQCHNHPFDNSKQEQFWAFNSFFQQAVVVRNEQYDAKTGKMVVAGIELATRDSEGPVYFETRNGLMRVAYPQFGSTRVDPGKATSRRRELARLMTQSDESSLAPAFVNRVWNQLHGRSFTPVVDDMGSHSPPSHPALLDRLSEEFVQSGYDVKQLLRWICNSDSYQLTSRFADGNARDNPEAGETALFSRMYVKPMSPEQLYDSLVVATQGQLAGGRTLDQSDQTRDQWLRQFVVSFETEENDETSTLDGSITQSLLMMNGELVRNATSIQPGTWLHELLTSREAESERIQALFQSALSRPATPKEQAMVRKLLKTSASHGRNVTAESVYQDVYWALLNSNEFILNH